MSQQAFLIDFFYEVGDGWTEYDFLPVVEDISLTDVTVGSADQAYYPVGYPSDHIRHIRLTDCTFSDVAEASEVEYVDDLVLTNVVVDGQRVDAPASPAPVGAGAGTP